MQVVILCGGMGTRLKSLVDNIPKPMASVSNKPFLYYVIELLKLNGFNKALMLTGYKSEIIEEYFTRNKFDIKISFKKEETPLGTGGALLNAWENLDNEFVLINGDTYFDIEYKNFFKFINEYKANACIALKLIEDTSRYGLVSFDENHKILKFIEKDAASNLKSGYINSGIYYFKKDILEDFYLKWHKASISIEKDIFPQLIEQRKLSACPMEGNFIDIGIPEDYLRAQSEVPEWLNNRRMEHNAI